jgi:sulfonate transport system substrate-binding protein
MTSASRFMKVAARLLAALTVATTLAAAAQAGTILRVGDQKGNARAVLEAANALAGVPYKIE